MSKHLIFYDGHCGFCDFCVCFVAKRDHKERFLFAPLQGETAAKKLKELKEEQKRADSLILIENYAENEKIHLFGKAAFRILWLLGGVWSLPGLFYFLPGFFYNFLYRLVAKYRHKIIPKSACEILQKDQRFLK